MPQIINTNIASLNAQRNLDRTQSDLATSLQRLSSGLRINSAKDDAAGLAISERMTTQIRGINQAVRNANDGVSLAQTAEGALGELTNNLQRIRELAVQSANATNSPSDRAALDLEVQQRLAEIDRIATQTSFNDLKVLDGSFGSASFQIGANVGETIGITLNTSMRTGAIGAVATAQSGDIGTAMEGTPAQANASGAAGEWTDAVSNANGQAFTMTVGGVQILSVTQADDNPETIDAARLQQAIDDAAGDLAAAGISVSGTVAGEDLAFTKADGTSFDIDITTDFNTTGGFAGADFAGNVTVDNGAEAVAGTPLALADGDFSVQVGDGDAVAITGTFSSVQELADAINAEVNGVAATANEDGTISLKSTQTITVGGAEAEGSLGFAAAEFTASGSLDGANVLTAAGANDTLLRIDSAITEVNNLRSTFGAIQNRFESTIANLSAVSENLSAARSRIMDADFAQETASLTRAQILQQAGVAILAQANSLPQMALSLLQ